MIYYTSTRLIFDQKWLFRPAADLTGGHDVFCGGHFILYDVIYQKHDVTYITSDQIGIIQAVLGLCGCQHSVQAYIWRFNGIMTSSYCWSDVMTSLKAKPEVKKKFQGSKCVNQVVFLCFRLILILNDVIT